MKGSRLRELERCFSADDIDVQEVARQGDRWILALRTARDDAARVIVVVEDTDGSLVVSVDAFSSRDAVGELNEYVPRWSDLKVETLAWAGPVALLWPRVASHVRAAFAALRED